MGRPEAEVLPALEELAAALGLLFIGIHNAWDSATHIVFADSHDDATRTE